MMPEIYFMLMETLRLRHAFKHLKMLSKEIDLRDYLSDKKSLDSNQFTDLLDYYANIEEYEICSKLMKKRNGI